MELLLTRKKPLVVTNNDFLEAFEDYSSSADSVHVSTGYVSVESLQYLLENAKKGVLPYLDLTIGMHHFDDFTKAQYDCAKSLADYLASSKRGSASICVSFPYHGKVYSFHKEGKPFVAIIGSSNLSGLLGSRDSYNFDVDVALEDPAVLNQLSDFQSDLKDKACKSLDDWEPTRKNVIDQEALIPIIGDSNSYFEGVAIRIRLQSMPCLVCKIEKKNCQWIKRLSIVVWKNWTENKMEKPGKI